MLHAVRLRIVRHKKLRSELTELLLEFKARETASLEAKITQCQSQDSFTLCQNDPIRILLLNANRKWFCKTFDNKRFARKTFLKSVSRKMFVKDPYHSSVKGLRTRA